MSKDIQEGKTKQKIYNSRLQNKVTTTNGITSMPGSISLTGITPVIPPLPHDTTLRPKVSSPHSHIFGQKHLTLSSDNVRTAINSNSILENKMKKGLVKRLI